MAKGTAKTYTLKAVCEQIAERQGKDVEKVSKTVRAFIRRNFDDLSEVWEGLAEAKENRDGNRYPPMGAEAAKRLLAVGTRSATDETDDEDEDE